MQAWKCYLQALFNVWSACLSQMLYTWSNLKLCVIKVNTIIRLNVCHKCYTYLVICNCNFVWTHIYLGPSIPCACSRTPNIFWYKLLCACARVEDRNNFEKRKTPLWKPFAYIHDISRIYTVQYGKMVHLMMILRVEIVSYTFSKILKK